jgi:hypothetical protein
MLLVIFGAGASYDSVPHLPPFQLSRVANQNNWNPLPELQSPGLHEQSRPPLANGLFDTRGIFVNVMSQFRECMEIVPWLRKPGVSVEGELARLQSEAPTYPRVHQELAAVRYYLHVALSVCMDGWRGAHFGATNYAVLLREIERWRLASSESVCIVTFNYDTMLEDAMNQVLGISLPNLNSYLQETYTLVKLHGSINWGREVDNQSALAAPHTYNPQRLITEAATLQISDRYRVVAGRPMYREGEPQRIVFPALSIPVERKDEFNCPSDHVQRLKDMLPNVTRVLTIGWRGAEKDFVDILHKLLAEKPSLMVVSGDAEGAKQTVKNLGVGMPGTYLTNSNPEPMTARVLVEGGFTGLMLNERDRLAEFLRSGLALVRPDRRS